MRRVAELPPLPRTAMSLIAWPVDASDDIDKAFISLWTDLIALYRGEYSASLFNEMTAISESTAIEKRSEFDETGCHQRRINMLQAEFSDTR